MEQHLPGMKNSRGPQNGGWVGIAVIAGAIALPAIARKAKPLIKKMGEALINIGGDLTRYGSTTEVQTEEPGGHEPKDDAAPQATVPTEVLKEEPIVSSPKAEDAAAPDPEPQPEPAQERAVAVEPPVSDLTQDQEEPEQPERQTDRSRRSRFSVPDDFETG